MYVVAQSWNEFLYTCKVMYVKIAWVGSRTTIKGGFYSIIVEASAFIFVNGVNQPVTYSILMAQGLTSLADKEMFRRVDDKTDELKADLVRRDIAVCHGIISNEKIYTESTI
jgi:hypothetical protein